MQDEPFRTTNLFVPSKNLNKDEFIKPLTRLESDERQLMKKIAFEETHYPNQYENHATCKLNSQFHARYDT